MVDPTGRMTARLHKKRIKEIRTEITVIDDSDIVGWMASFTRVDEIYMNDVDSMVDNVIKRSAGEKIRRLNILDHGNNNGVEIGKDWITMENVVTYETKLGKLKRHFADDGFVHLQHCDVGQNRILLRYLSKLWGVPVYAGTGSHNPVYRINYGEYTKCYPNEKCFDDVDRP